MRRSKVQSTKCFCCGWSCFEQLNSDRHPVNVCHNRKGTEDGFMCPVFMRVNYKVYLRDGAIKNEAFMAKMERIHNAIGEKIAHEG